jgi:hypothetical protein
MLMHCDSILPHLQVQHVCIAVTLFHYEYACQQISLLLRNFRLKSAIPYTHPDISHVIRVDEGLLEFGTKQQQFMEYKDERLATVAPVTILMLQCL